MLADLRQILKQALKQQHGGGVLRQERTSFSTPTATPVDPPLVIATTRGAQALHDFGLSPDAANVLATTYPEDHIMAKLDLVQWLQREHPKQVRNNPAGFLRRAIERDYAPPADYQTPVQRAAAVKAKAETTAGEERQLRTAEEQYRQAKEQTEQRLREHCPPQPVTGTGLTTHEVWNTVQAALAEQLTGPNFHMWLKPTMLVSCDETTALVATTSPYHADHLADRRGHGADWVGFVR
jgi:hypothetical protein